MRSLHRVVALALLCVTVPLGPALAQEPVDSPRLHELRFNWARDGAITGTAGVLWISSELFKENLAPEQCRWCDRNPDGTSNLSGLNRWGRGLSGETDETRHRANLWSNVIGFGVLPASVLGLQYAAGRGSDSPGHFFAQDASIIVESAVLASLANQTVKFIAGRERPFVHVLPDNEKGRTEQPSDNNLSFYSGHTSLAFSLVVSAGTVAAMRGYDHQEWIWGVGIPLAASVGMLRMGADKHYLTDVLAGALLGSAFGVGVPLLLHGRSGSAAPLNRNASSVRVTPSLGMGMAGISGQF